MRKETFVHFAFFLSFFILVSVIRNYLSLSYWPFWVGGVIGTVIPDIDHLIYIFFLNPQELTSQRVNFLLKKREIKRTLALLYETREERKNLIFHTFFFQIIFLMFTFLIFTSSTSVLVKGIVLAFSLHIIIDQVVDIFYTKNLDNWGKLGTTNFSFKTSIFYILASFLLVCIIGFLM